jgi:choline dehydrogenase-like flavoprotein
VSEFDYVIVGAGSAGCVLANRLSDSGAEVLLVEAGGRDRSPKIKIPAAFAQQFQTKLDWDYASGPEPGCDGRSLYVPRGKALGGSSSMNAMLYVRGHRGDYDGWRDEAGCPGWGWDDVLPYFVRSEHREAGGSAIHGYGGLLNVAERRDPRPLTALMLAAAEALGHPVDPDYNDGEPRGACAVEVTQKRGRRWSAADGFLRPAAGRPNLTVLTGATALGIDLRDGRAHGVRLAGKTPMAVARARREVILAAGAIGSPQLLMLSGIGDPDALGRAGVEARVPLPAVGANLQDHPYVVGIWDSTIGGSLADAEEPRAMLDFLLRRRGPLTSSVAEAFLFTRSDGGDGAPDLQLHLAPAYFADNGFEEYDGHAMTIGPVLIAPRSRGSVALRSADPDAKPAIVGNHLSEQADVDALVRGVELARELVATAPLAAAAGREIYPGPGIDGNEALAADARRRAELLYHPVGTCRMGGDESSVVDPELRVRGVEGLRVIDASVMPTITRGNTNAPTIMIAEKGADLLLDREPPAAVA